jgi:TolA-binding protein
MKPNITDQIIAYLNGELNNEASARLMEEIKTNPELEEEYLLLKGLHEDVHDENNLDYLFAKRMDSKYNGLPEETAFKNESISRGNVRILRYLTYAAAAVSVIMLIYFLTSQDNDNLRSESLYAKYYIGYDQIVEMRSGEDTSGMFDNGMKLYSSGNWEEAIHSLNQARQNFELTAAFYIGMCYMELQEYAKAEIQFHRVIDQSGDFRQEAEWYLALALLADNKTEQSKALLQAIVVQKNHYFGKIAKELLDDMKRITPE